MLEAIRLLGCLLLIFGLYPSRDYMISTGICYPLRDIHIAGNGVWGSPLTPVVMPKQPLHKQINRPEQFEEAAARIGVRAQCCPIGNERFHASLRLLPLNGVGLIAVRAAPIRVLIEPPHDFFGLTIPLDRPFVAQDRGISRSFDQHEAHLFDCEEEFDLHAVNGCGAFGATFKVIPLLNYARRLNQSESPLTVEPCLSLSAPAGIDLQRALAKVWSEFESSRGVESAFAKEELEDELIAAFVLAADSHHDGNGHRDRMGPRYFNRAEDYLLDNLDKAVTRDKLAEYTGVSIRTLSRAFLKKYGIGPIGFLKQRRLDAAYRALTGAKPGSCSVTEVAVRYGFNHLGKFAVEYRRTFGESPSVSLTH